MIRTLALALMLTLMPAAANAATARRAASKPARAASPAQAKSPAASGKRPAGSDSSGASAGGSRTLDEIHIEGEVAVPQVLFITARDQRRFMDFQNHRYLKSSRQLGQSTIYPQWIQMNSSSAIEARKEPSR